MNESEKAKAKETEKTEEKEKAKSAASTEEKASQPAEASNLQLSESGPFEVNFLQTHDEAEENHENK